MRLVTSIEMLRSTRVSTRQAGRRTVRSVTKLLSSTTALCRPTQPGSQLTSCSCSCSLQQFTFVSLNTRLQQQENVSINRESGPAPARSRQMQPHWAKAKGSLGSCKDGRAISIGSSSAQTWFYSSLLRRFLLYIHDDFGCDTNGVDCC